MQQLSSQRAHASLLAHGAEESPHQIMKANTPCEIRVQTYIIYDMECYAVP